MAPITRRHGAMIGLGEAWRDVLGAGPVDCFELQREAALGQAKVAGGGEFRGEVGLGLQIMRAQMGEDLQPSPARIIDQDQSHAIIGRDVAEADILAVAAIVGEPSVVSSSTRRKPGGPPRCCRCGHTEAETLERWKLSRPATIPILPQEPLAPVTRARLRR